jgi:hypothetical protein
MYKKVCWMDRMRSRPSGSPQTSRVFLYHNDGQISKLNFKIDSCDRGLVTKGRFFFWVRSQIANSKQLNEHIHCGTLPTLHLTLLTNYNKYCRVNIYRARCLLIFSLDIDLLLGTAFRATAGLQAEFKVRETTLSSHFCYEGRVALPLS